MEETKISNSNIICKEKSYKYLISVVVVLNSNLDHTKLCMETLYRYCKDIDFELITINNHSSYANDEYFNSLSNTKKINLGRNESNAAAFNKGLAMSEGELILFTSSNIIFTENSINNLIDCLKSDDNIGMVVPACNLASNNQKVCLSYNGNEELFMVSKKYSISNSNKWEERIILEFYMCLMRTKDISDIGGFNEFYYPGNFDGYDLCFRIRRAGKRLIFAGDTYIHRWESISEDKLNINNKMFLSIYGVDAIKDTNVDMEVVNSVSYNKNKKIKALNIGTSCGATLLQIKNKFKISGIHDIELWYLCMEENRVIDLKTISEHVIYDRTMDIIKSFESDLFDYIIIDTPLQKLKNPEYILKEIKRILKNDGQLIFFIENESNYKNILSLIAGEVDYSEKVNCCSPVVMSKLLQFYGYKDVNSFYYWDEARVEYTGIIDKLKDSSPITNKSSLDFNLGIKKIIFTVNGKHTTKNILVYPGYDWLLNDVFVKYDLQRELLGLNNGESVFSIMKEKLSNAGYRLCSIDNGDINEADFIIYMDAPKACGNIFFKHLYHNIYKGKVYFDECVKMRKLKGTKMVLIIQEPNVVMPENYDETMHDCFDVIFTYNDDMVDGKKYFKYYSPEPVGVKNIYNRSFADRKLLTTISSDKYSDIPGELYSKRVEAIYFFDKNHPDSFEFYGRGWGHRGLKSWMGDVPGKLEVMSKYKFCICYENERVNGWVSEKIFDGFFSGCIPIYLGAPNVTDYIPENTFIDQRKFDSYEELYNFISKITEEEYQEYINNINAFIDSEKFMKFSYEAFVQSIVSALMKF